MKWIERLLEDDRTYSPKEIIPMFIVTILAVSLLTVLMFFPVWVLF